MTRIGGTVERAEKAQIERVINHNLKERFAAGAVRRAVLLEYGEDPAIEPGQLMVRVFVPAPHLVHPGPAARVHLRGSRGRDTADHDAG